MCRYRWGVDPRQPLPPGLRDNGKAMCLAVYVASMEQLPAAAGRQVERVKGRRVPVRLFPGQHVYAVLGGCACALLSDGATSEEHDERRALLDRLTEWLSEAASEAPTQALICWSGDEGREPENVTVRALDVGRLDFDRAWETPMLVTILSG